jgi:hypothetical protein
MIHEFISVNRDQIIARCREKVALRALPPRIAAATDHGVPVFLEQLVDALRLGQHSSAAIGPTAVQHGHDMLLQGFTVSQVVHEYGDVCQAITEIAVEMDAPIGTEDFGTLNRCLDDAIAGAVTEYGRARNQSTLDDEALRGSERLGFFAHELRNLVNTAIMAFDVVKTGNVGVAGSTGTVLHRSLMGVHALIARSLAEVRLTQGVQNREPVLVAGFIGDLAMAATLEADARGIRLIVLPIDQGAAIEVDRQVMAAAVTNVLQNAFKFTRPRSTVTLEVVASATRVLLEIRDECDGLPPGNVEDLFRPFEQRSADRTGFGLGLAFSRWGVEANNGRISARNLPEGGCVFTIDLPRLPIAAALPV